MGKRRQVIAALLLGVAYFAMSRFVLAFLTHGPGIPAIWPSGGIALAALLTVSPRRWPLLAVAVFTADFAAALPEVDVKIALGFAAVDVFEALVAATVARRMSGTRPPLSMRSVGAIVGATALATALGAVPGSLLVAAAFDAPALDFVTHWWLADGVGVLAFAPLVFALSAEARRVSRPRPAELLPFVALAFTVCAVFLDTPDLGDVVEFPYLVLPLLMWVAVKLRPAMLVSALAMVTIAAQYGTCHGLGTFTRAELSSHEEIYAVQVFLAVALVATLLVAAGAHAVRRSEVLYRLLAEYSGDIISRHDLAGGVATYVSPAVRQIVGRLPRDVVGIWVGDYCHPEDRAELDQGLERLRGGSQEETLTYRVPDGSGKWRWMESTLRCLPEPALEFVACTRDVTDRMTIAHALEDSERLHRLMLQNLPGAIVMLWDGDLRLRSMRGERLGLERPNLQEYNGRALDEVLPSHGVVQMERPLRAALAGEESVVVYEHADAGRSFEVHIAPFTGSDGHVEGAMMVALDITDRMQAERALLTAEARFRGAFEHAPIGIALSGLDGRLRAVNPALCAMLGLDAEILHGQWLGAYAHPDDVAALRRAARAMAAGEVDEWSGEVRLRHMNGRTVRAAFQAALVRDADGRPDFLLEQLQDVTARRRDEEHLRFLADHDPLTGLPNRRRLEAELDRHLARARRGPVEGALLMLDIDHFKQVNDTIGHSAGDELIVAVAGMLRSRLRESDLLVRLGGDEFAVLLPSGDREAAAAVADALVRGVRDTAALLRGERRAVTISVGVAPLQGQPVPTADELLIEADLAMYDAKEGGRDRYELSAGPGEETPQTKARLAWIERIREALERDDFVLEAQPIVNLHADRASMYELLIRMTDDNGDLVPPASFLPIAERYDLMAQIDAWVAARAVRLIAAEHEEGRDLRLAVNISGRSLGHATVLQTINRAIDEHPIPDGSLIVEVTETAAVSNIVAARRFALELSALGCRFALDDFGAGFGSFYYLKHLPFDFVKIDGEFVKGMRTNRTDQLVVEAVVRIARGLGKETIAEFVPDQRTAELLRGMGVDHGQGFHLGRPMPVAALRRAAAPH